MNKVTLAELRAIPALETVPDDQLQWLLDNGETRELEAGEHLAEANTPLNYTYILIEGRIRLCMVQNGKLREMAVVQAHSITGYLPFSRATKTPGYTECTKKTRLLSISKTRMQDAIKLHYELTEAMVHAMTSRVRDFTFVQQQNEKMFALGKLSAGLAHELNNPASAITRGAAALQCQVKHLPELFKDVATIDMLSQKIDSINQLLINKTTQTNRPILTMLQRADKEDEITDWLIDHNIKDLNMAENLAEFDFSPADLEHLNSCTPTPKLGVVLAWMNNYLLQEKMVDDIRDASQRISELVNAVKNFTHMDRDTDKQFLDIHTGLRNTVTMLNYKLRKHQIEVQEIFDTSLPRVRALAGELNQVWTNLIDNAIDALENTSNGRLTIRTQKDGDFVCVYICDNGPGIPADIQPQIFDLFFTTKEIGKGSGIGLDVVTRIIRQHNGSVKVTSEPGNTVFTVCFPINDN